MGRVANNLGSIQGLLEPHLERMFFKFEFSRSAQVFLVFTGFSSSLYTRGTGSIGRPEGMLISAFDKPSYIGWKDNEMFEFFARNFTQTRAMGVEV